MLSPHFDIGADIVADVQPALTFAGQTRSRFGVELPVDFVFFETDETSRAS